MQPRKFASHGWRGAILIAIAYVDFLIFAQFAFLKRLAEMGIGDAHLKAVMAAMAAGGILLSLLAPRIHVFPSPRLRLSAGYCVSAISAFLALLPLRFFAAAAVSFLIGAGLGLPTVTLVTHLRRWTGDRKALLSVGAGTGIGYFICNLPPFFVAAAEVQALTAGVLCLVGAGIALLPAATSIDPKPVAAQPRFSMPRALTAFTALVWLDSAAFFIIQNNRALKAETWQGTAHLWSIGVLHLAAAFASAWLLRRRGVFAVLSSSFLALGGACLLLNADRAALASLLYPVGVSLYSVALIAYPSLIAAASSTEERGRIAGWIYSVAGWGGSAMGIGMAQHLGHVPIGFVIAAGVAILFPFAISLGRARIRESVLTGLIALSALFLDRMVPARDTRHLTQIERGRLVYISEGCIHCHSQYVRPHTADELMWGPAEPVETIRREQPPLIGNRRQGPDLSQVGQRRSTLWLKAHFFDPAEVSGASVMPSYGFLFGDERGDDLVAYLKSLQSNDLGQHASEEAHWSASSVAQSHATAAEGARLYQMDCATCHDRDGRTRVSWQSSFNQLPVDLSRGPYQYIALPKLKDGLVCELERITKFGIPKSDMPGHEYLSDRQISSISLWLAQVIAQPNQNAMNTYQPGGEDR